MRFRIPVSLRHFWQLLEKRHKHYLPLLLLANVLATLLELVSIGAVPAFISLLANPAILSHYGLAFLIPQDYDKLQMVLWSCLGFALVFGVRTVFIIGNRILQQHFIRQLEIHLSNRLFTLYMNAPYTFHLQRNSAALITNLRTNTLAISGQIVLPFLLLAQHSLLLIAVSTLLMTVEPVVTLISLLLFSGFSAFFVRYTSRRLRHYGNQFKEQNRLSLQILQQSLDGFKEITVLGKRNYFIEKFRHTLNIQAQVKMSQTIISSFSTPLMELLAVFTLIGIVLGLFLRYQSFSAVAALLGLFAIAFIRIKSSFSSLLQIYANLRYNLVFIEPVFQDIGTLSEESYRSTQPPAKTAVESGILRLREVISIENVSFRYPVSEAQVLHHINLRIPKGSSAAFVGPSGAGKSTLIDILLGILPPGEGKILADGKDISQDLARWQGDIGYVPQFIHLSDDSVRNNIALGIDPSAIDPARIAQALTDAQLKTFVEGLPQGVDTVVGERGVRFSGGQRQRVGIARALYRQPDILIFDEATSALDSATEREIIETVKALRGQRTIIMVAHRLTTVQHCDIIFVLDKGCLVAQGSYRELLETSPLFRKMAHSHH